MLSAASLGDTFAAWRARAAEHGPSSTPSSTFEHGPISTFTTREEADL